MVFPKKLREVRPYLGSLASRGKRFVTRHRPVVIGVSVFAVLGVFLSAWAFSDETAPRKTHRVAYSSSKSAVPNRTLVKKSAGDPLAAGRRLFDAKKYDAAIDAFQPLVDNNVEARFWLGKAHLAAGNDFRGCRQLGKYLQFAPRGRYAKAAKTSMKKC